MDSFSERKRGDGLLANDSRKNCQYMDNNQKLNWLMTNEDKQLLVQLFEMILKTGI